MGRWKYGSYLLDAEIIGMPFLSIRRRRKSFLRPKEETSKYHYYYCVGSVVHLAVMVSFRLLLNWMFLLFRICILAAWASACDITGEFVAVFTITWVFSPGTLLRLQLAGLCQLLSDAPLHRFISWPTVATAVSLHPNEFVAINWYMPCGAVTVLDVFHWAVRPVVLYKGLRFTISPKQTIAASVSGPR